MLSCSKSAARAARSVLVRGNCAVLCGRLCLDILEHCLTQTSKTAVTGQGAHESASLDLDLSWLSLVPAPPEPRRLVKVPSAQTLPSTAPYDLDPGILRVKTDGQPKDVCLSTYPVTPTKVQLLPSTRRLSEEVLLKLPASAQVFRDDTALSLCSRDRKIKPFKCTRTRYRFSKNFIKHTCLTHPESPHGLLFRCRSCGWQLLLHVIHRHDRFLCLLQKYA